MFFRIFMVCVVLASCYAAYQLYTMKKYYEDLASPLASFAVKNQGNHSGLTIVEFMNYDCMYCRSSHVVFLEFVKENPDVRYVVRPVPNANDGAETAAELALAAGLQHKFWEFDKALASYSGKIDEAFYRKTAQDIGLDYDLLVKDADDTDVQVMAGDNAQAVLKTGAVRMPVFMIGRTLYQLDKPLTLPELLRMVEAEKAR